MRRSSPIAPPCVKPVEISPAADHQQQTSCLAGGALIYGMVGGTSKSGRFLLTIAVVAAVLSACAAERTGGPLVEPLPDSIAAGQFTRCNVGDTTVTVAMKRENWVQIGRASCRGRVEGSGV